MIPGPDAEDIKTYLGALAEGRLIVRHCNACGEHHDYPRSYCPLCGSGDTDWTQSQGVGEVYSITIWRTKAGATVPAYVTLPEGPTMLALIAGDDAESVRIGDRVQFSGIQPDSRLPTFLRVASQPAPQSGASYDI